MEAMGDRTMVVQFEGTLLKAVDPFPYFMLLAFESDSLGLVRFALLLMLWPVLKLLDRMGRAGLALRATVFVAVAGVKAAEVEAAARAVLPKFFMEELDVATWRAFRVAGRKMVVVTRWPRVMVEWFAKEHLYADAIVGREIEVNRFGFASGLIEEEEVAAMKLTAVFGSKPVDVGLGRLESVRCLSPCEEKYRTRISLASLNLTGPDELNRPRPVIFHDSRLVVRPTPLTSLLILLWFPLGFALAVLRIAFGLLIPFRWMRFVAPLLGGKLIVRGRPPPPPAAATSGVLFVCTHRTLMDPVVLSTVLGRRVPAVTYSISRLTELLSPIPTVRLSRDRTVDGARIRAELARGDLAVCPEGTTCREPFLLRFSALFAELTDRIQPVAMNHRVGVFHATTARGWKAMDPIHFFMNPRPVYEVTFLGQLPAEATCGAGGRSAYDVANHVQRLLAAALGFECTNFTRRDKYQVLAGNDGVVGNSKSPATWVTWPWVVKTTELLQFLMH